MTIQKARKLLGKLAEDMTDGQVQEHINQTSILCDTLFDMAIKNIKEGKTIKDVKKSMSQKVK
jgi:hypothetical protein